MFGPRGSGLGWHRLTLGEVVLEDFEATVVVRDEAEGFVGGGCNARVSDLAAIFQDAVDGKEEIVHSRTLSDVAIQGRECPIQGEEMIVRHTPHTNKEPPARG